MIRVEKLSKSFHIHILGHKVIRGCGQVSFSAKIGDFLGLSGASGAGKSTVLKCIYRTYLPTSGAIYFESGIYGTVNLTEIPEHMILEIRSREIGYVSQFLNVIPRVSAMDIVAEPLMRKNGLSPEKAKKRAGELLERLQIPSNLFDTYPATFSGGEQQRINLARSFIWKPRLLLLDEPTASLDHDSVSVVLEILGELRKNGSTMIGIFHDSALMESVTDRIYRVENEEENHASRK